MAIEVLPAQFQLLEFDAERIRGLAAEVAEAAGFGPDVNIQVAVDETTPLTQVRIVTSEPVVLHVESGAFEDPHSPRVLGDNAVRTALSIPMFRVFDRRQPGFSDAPAEAALTHEQRAAWEVSAAGRANRAGLPSPRPRRLYGFRVRHGFTDVADAVFERLWTSADPSWDLVQEACAETAGARA
jgi:hypothetical protein